MVERVLSEWVEECRKVLAAELRSVILYGSAAEGKLRASSDVNVLLVLTTFDPAKIAQLRPQLQQYEAAVRLSVMFLLEEEIGAAMEDFAAKFADILRRRKVLYGEDPFAGRSISRASEIARLKQVSLNLVLRMRAAYASRSREELLVMTVAEAAGPLRSCAALILELEGHPAGSAKQALETIVAAPDREALAQMSQARETRLLPPDVASQTLLKLIEIARSMHVRAQSLS